MIFRHLLNMRSHPTWVRGLKLAGDYEIIYQQESHPTWVRGLKLESDSTFNHQRCRTLRGCVD